MTTEPSLISEREREILRLVAMGATNQQIASQLNISINTVKVHLRNIFGKIGAASRTEATVYAIQQGLVTLDRPLDMVETPPQGQAPFATAPADAAAPMSMLPEAASAAMTHPAQADAEPAAANPDSLAHAEYVITAPAPPVPVPVPIWRRRIVLLGAVVAALIVVLGLLAAMFLQQRRTPPIEATVVPAVPQGRWRPRAALPQPRTDFGAVSYDDKIYVVGGRAASGPSASIERYDPATNIWAPLNGKPTPVSHIQAAIVRGIIYVPGGEGADGQVLATLESYDPRNQRWEKLAPLPKPRSRYALASVEGRLFLFGGWDGTSYQADVFVYDPEGNRWSTGDPLRTARRDAGAAAVEGRIYIIGGTNESGALSLNERYDPNGNPGAQWASATPLQFVSAAPAVVNLSSNIWVFDPQQHMALQYNPTADAWKLIAIPNTIPVSPQAVSSNDTSVFLFGATGDDSAALNEYQVIYNLFLPNTESNP